MAEKLTRLPDAISLDAKPTDVPKGSKVVQNKNGNWEVYYPKKYREQLDVTRSGTGKTRVGPLSRVGGGLGGIFGIKNR